MSIKEQYQETLQYLYYQLPAFQRIGPVAMKKDLTNIRALCQHLGQPHKKYSCIHIAGTNGKGSTAHMLSAVLTSAGYRVGLYTSPHYKDFRERIKINGGYISKEKVITFVRQNKSFIKDLKPSFFEISVAMALSHFANEKVEIAVIETGLGGRLDSTNIITPVLSIITNIAYDHQQFLGNTLPEIAGEKAGIIKQGIPVVIGETEEETKQVFLDYARNRNAPIIFAEDHYRIREISHGLQHSVYDVHKEKRVLFKGLKVGLHGPFQQKNLGTVLQSLELLQENPVFDRLNKKAIKKGLENIKQLSCFIGRWHPIRDQPLVLCDSAHNEAGIQIAMDEIKRMQYVNLHMVIGFVKDKDLNKILPLFPKTAHYYFAKAAILRGLDARVLAEKASAFQLKGKSYSSVKNAFRAALRHAAKDDLIFIGGSTFTVAEVM